MAIIYLTHGFIGSGKTTFSKKFCHDNNIIRFSSDEIMTSIYGNNPPKEHFQSYFDNVHDLIKKLTIEVISKDKDVLIDLGLWSKKERDEWRAFAKSINAEAIIIYVDCPEEIALKRTLQRTQTMPDGQFFINKEGFYILKEKFEPLEENEKHIYIDGTKK